MLRVVFGGFIGGKMVGKGSWRLGGVKVSEAHQGGLGKKMMFEFVQMTKRKLMREMQKLG